MGKTRAIRLAIMIVTILLFIISPITKATIDTGSYRPSDPNAEDVEKILGIANPIVGTIKVIGIVIAVITLMLLGFKYMTGSVSEKAEYKKTMIPYLVGAVLVVAITQLLGVIIEIVTDIQ